MYSMAGDIKGAARKREGPSGRLKRSPAFAGSAPDIGRALRFKAHFE
jgi:hypothetical protein